MRNTTDIDPAEKGRESVRRWYARHRVEYSELRRQRYKSDVKRRKKARADAARYRRERIEGLKVQRVLSREVRGVKIEVFTSGYIADRIKVSPQMIRAWEARGWIPKPLFTGEKHRLYTARQMALMRLLADAVRNKKRKPDQTMLLEVISVVHKTWKVIDHADKNSQKARRSRR
jgi:hypothetical protein